MLLIPMQAEPNQTVTITLANQICQINVYQKDYGLFLDLYVDNSAIIVGQLCENNNRIVVSQYLGFLGDVMFTDTQGDSDPVYIDIGSRFFLVYLEVADLS